LGTRITDLKEGDLVWVFDYSKRPSQDKLGVLLKKTYPDNEQNYLYDVLLEGKVHAFHVFDLAAYYSANEESDER
jgi:hypothetical protein